MEICVLASNNSWHTSRNDTLVFLIFAKGEPMRCEQTRSHRVFGDGDQRLAKQAVPCTPTYPPQSVSDGIRGVADRSIQCE